MEKHLQPSFHNFFLTPMAQMHSQALLALWVRLCHLAMTSWALFPERKVQSFPTDLGNFCFGPRRKKWVGKRIALVCYLSVSFHSCCSNLQAGNRGLGHFDIFDLQGGQKRWMLPSGDMLLYLILEKKMLLFSLENCAKEFSWFLPCKLPLTLVIQKFIFI